MSDLSFPGQTEGIMKRTASRGSDQCRRPLTPDGRRIIRAGFDSDPEKTGEHIPETLAKSMNEGMADSACGRAER